METTNIDKVSLQLTFYTGSTIDPTYTRTFGYISPTATDERLNAFIDKIDNISRNDVTIRRKIVVYTLEEG